MMLVAGLVLVELVSLVFIHKTRLQRDMTGKRYECLGSHSFFHSSAKEDPGIAGSLSSPLLSNNGALLLPDQLLGLL